MRPTLFFTVAILRQLPLGFCKHSTKGIPQSQHPERSKRGGSRPLWASLPRLSTCHDQDLLFYRLRRIGQSVSARTWYQPKEDLYSDQREINTKGCKVAIGVTQCAAMGDNS